MFHANPCLHALAPQPVRWGHLIDFDWSCTRNNALLAKRELTYLTTSSLHLRRVWTPIPQDTEQELQGAQWQVLKKKWKLALIHFLALLDSSISETWPDQQKGKDNDKDKDMRTYNDKEKDVKNVDKIADVTWERESDTGECLQFLATFFKLTKLTH